MLPTVDLKNISDDRTEDSLSAADMLSCLANKQSVENTNLLSCVKCRSVSPQNVNSGQSVTLSAVRSDHAAQPASYKNHFFSEFCTSSVICSPEAVRNGRICDCHSWRRWCWPASSSAWVGPASRTSLEQRELYTLMSKRKVMPLGDSTAKQSVKKTAQHWHLVTARFAHVAVCCVNTEQWCTAIESLHCFTRWLVLSSKVNDFCVVWKAMTHIESESWHKIYYIRCMKANCCLKFSKMNKILLSQLGALCGISFSCLVLWGSDN